MKRYAVNFLINVRKIVACDQRRRRLKDSVMKDSYARGMAEAKMDGMIVLPDARPPDMMLLAAITQRPFCGEHYRYGAVGAAAYRRHDCGGELAHIRQPPEHGLIGSIAPCRERSVLEQMPGGLSVSVNVLGMQPASFLAPALRGPWHSVI